MESWVSKELYTLIGRWWSTVEWGCQHHLQIQSLRSLFYRTLLKTCLNLVLSHYLCLAFSFSFLIMSSLSHGCWNSHACNLQLDSTHAVQVGPLHHERSEERNLERFRTINYFTTIISQLWSSRLSNGLSLTNKFTIFFHHSYSVTSQLWHKIVK